MTKKKLITYDQLNKLAKGIYSTLHGEVQTVASSALTNQNAISALSGRVTTAEGKLDTINGSETTAGSIAKALKDAKAYADQQDGTLHTTITGEINAAKTGLQANIDKKADAKAMTTALADKADKTALETEVSRAQGAEGTLSGRLDVIEGEENVEGSIKKALKDAKADAAANYATKATVAGIDTRVGTAESDIDALETAVGTDEHGNLVKVADRISAVNTAAGELAGRVTQNEKDIKAIKDDYLKKADKDELAGKITEAKTQADKGVADAAKAQGVADYAKGKIDTFMASAEIGDKAVDTLKEIQKYITDDGAAAQKMTADIAARVLKTDYDAKVQTLEAADAALGNRATALETLVGKEAEGGNEASGLVKKVADNKAAIATNKTDIANLKKAMGEVEHVAAQSALEAVSGRVTTVEGKVTKLETAVGTKAAEGKAATGLYKEITDEAARAKGVEGGLRTDVDTLKNTVGNASKGLVKGVNDLQKAVTDLQGTDHTHANKTTLDAITATVKNGYDDAVAKVTGDAGTEGTIANAKKAGTDAKKAVDGLTITATNVEVDGVVTGVTVALGNGKSTQIDYPYEFVTDAEIEAIISGLGKQA